MSKPQGIPPLVLHRIKVNVGAAKPFKAVQLGDVHMVRVDSSDDQRKIALAAARYQEMKLGEHYLEEAIGIARKKHAVLLHVGDMIDFVSHANLEYAGMIFGSDDWFACAGNHEYSRYVGEANENAEYKAGTFDEVSKEFPNNLTFASRVINGVNFVAVDDVYYNFTAEQLALMKREVAKGMPIVFMCHVPFYAPRHYRSQLKKTNGLCSYETGIPDELISTWKKIDYPEDQLWRDRRVQQRADAETKDFVKYVESEPLVKAVLCGHTHDFSKERISPFAKMYVCGAVYEGTANLLEFI